MAVSTIKNGFVKIIPSYIKDARIAGVNDGRLTIGADMINQTEVYVVQVVFSKNYIRVDLSDGPQRMYYPS